MFESSLAPPPSKRKPNWIYITPLAIAILPLIRIGLRHNPPLRNKVFYGAVGVFFIHGTWLITRTEDYDDEGNSGTLSSTKETYIRTPVPRVRTTSSPSSSAVPASSSTLPDTGSAVESKDTARKSLQ